VTTRTLCGSRSLSPSRTWSWQWSSTGSREQYFIASTTKLYVSAIVMQLRAEGRLDIDAPAATYLDPSVMRGIHVLDGVDSSARITVRQLLAHDIGWTFDDVLRITKEDRRPRFAPGARILGPLGLGATYPFATETLSRYDEVAAMLDGTRRLAIPRAMASVRSDGGIVSTATDGLAFLEAFMTGRLFPIGSLDEMQLRWNRVFRPLEYGVGIMRFALPRYFSPFRPCPPMVGHSGASGAVLFHVPKLDLYISGTVNQIRSRSLSYRLLSRLVMSCDGAWGRRR
jgi:D-alanyl-D-alanine carboxypeptidase